MDSSLWTGPPESAVAPYNLNDLVSRPARSPVEVSPGEATLASWAVVVLIASSALQFAFLAALKASVPKQLVPMTNHTVRAVLDYGQYGKSVPFFITPLQDAIATWLYIPAGLAVLVLLGLWAIAKLRAVSRR